MNDVQVCFRHVSSMLQVQVCSGMFQVYVTSLSLLQAYVCYKFMLLQVYVCYKFKSVTSSRMLQVQGCYKFFVSRALCQLFKGFMPSFQGP